MSSLNNQWKLSPNVQYIVDGAIHKAAGEFLLEENKTHNGCMNGEAKLSCGYCLPAKCI